DAWAEKAKEYMITAYAAPQDVGSERIVDGKPLKEWVRGPNVHEDYTCENHGFVHPDYLTAYDLQVTNTFVYRLAGEPLPEAPLFNIAECRKVLSFLTRPSGWFFYPQWCDWTNYGFDVTIEAQILDPFVPDPVGARCLRSSLDFLKYTDKCHGAGPSTNLFHGVNYACTPLFMLNEAYIVFYLFGPGAKPASDEEARTKLRGTMISEAGKFAVSRSKDGMASFSWFDGGERFMASVTPLAIDAPTVPKLRSLVGYVSSKDDHIKVVSRKVEQLPGGGFSAGFSIKRGPGFGVSERLMMMALADGRVVYAEWFDSEPAGNTEEVRTGLIFLEDDPYWLRGKKPIVYCPGGVFRLKPEKVSNGDDDARPKPEQVLLGGDDARWINYNNRLGIVLRGSRQVLLEGSQLALNYRGPSGGQLPEFWVAVFYPNATKAMTAKFDQVVSINKLGNGSYEVFLGDVAITLDPAEKAVVTRQSHRRGTE
ncbi:MAG: hypothetical protein Q7T82_11105, partial [Armatimonadota bacterium]|nr:hypothetical protein [Armatimonadota bacterium]